MAPNGAELSNESATRKEVARLLKRDLESLDAALELGLKLVVANGEVNCLPGLPLRTAQIAMALYAKSFKTVRAIRLIASTGLVEDGHTLCRSLLETCVAIHYLLQKDWEIRGKEYAAFTVLKDLTTANGWKGTKGLQEDGVLLEAAVRKTIAKHLADIPEDRQEILRTRGYAGMKLDATFREVGMGIHYQLAYRSLSPHAHASDWMEHFDWDPNRGLALHLGSADVPELRRLLNSSRWFFAGIMELISKAMGFGYLAAIDKFNADLDDPSIDVVRAWRARVDEREEKARLENRRPEGGSGP